jgi:hypothetical protein
VVEPKRATYLASYLLITLIRLAATRRVGMMLNDNTPIITVKEARKILGKRYVKYSDDYIESLIKNLDGIAEAYIKMFPKH